MFRFGLITGLALLPMAVSAQPVYVDDLERAKEKIEKLRDFEFPAIAIEKKFATEDMMRLKDNLKGLEKFELKGLAKPMTMAADALGMAAQMKQFAYFQGPGPVKISGERARDEERVYRDGKRALEQRE